MSKKDANWTVYILRCADGTLYTGITTNLERRITEHNSDDSKAARYTKSRRPVKLVFQEYCVDRVQASKREYHIKQMSRTQKLDLLINQKSAII